MAVSPRAFPPTEGRPSAGSFALSTFSDRILCQSLLTLSREISSLQPLQPLLKRTSASIIRKVKLLAELFEEILRNPVISLPQSAILCFEEMYVVFQRLKALIEEYSDGKSVMWLLLQNDVISNIFHELTVDLFTLLDILPVKELELNDDVEEFVAFVTKQCSSTKSRVEPPPDDDNLRLEVLEMLDRIEREIVPDPSKLSVIFDRLQLRDSSSCRDEIERLEDEVRSQTTEKAKAQAIALIGLVRYAKCVLYGASTPRNTPRRRDSASDITFPADFRCPISLDLMTDPVVVSTGQTYDRASISLWIESGHNTCPKTGQPLAHPELLPNHALKNLIAMWCRQQRIPYQAPDGSTEKTKGFLGFNKKALEVTKMTATFLVNELTVSNSVEAVNRLVHELRALAKTDSDCRACIAEAGALPLLVKFLGSDHPSLQVNAVTTILNLSILEANKARIMETEGVLNGVIEVLRSGATWEAKGNAAAAIFSLTGVQAYRKRLGKKTRVVNGLMDLARDGSTNSKKDALVAILNLAGDRDTVGKLLQGGVVEVIGELMKNGDGLREEAVSILEVVVKRGGVGAIAAAYNHGVIRKLGGVLRDGTDSGRESAVTVLVYVCRKGGSEMVAEVAAITGIERLLWEVMGMGTGRGRRKAAALLRILTRWASSGLRGMDVSSTMTIVLPG